MADYPIAKINTAFIFYVSLPSQANVNVFQVNPTLAAGDVTVSIDGAAATNITTLPTVTPAGGKRVKVSLSAAEMNGDNISVVFSDVAGAEWCDQQFDIPTSVRGVADLGTSTYAGGAVASVTAGVLLSVGTGAGQINASGGKVPATVATGDDTDAATMLLRLTSARAGYLDNLNVGGVLASHADVLAVNQSASKHLLLVTVGQFEPGETYTVEMRTFAAADGSAVNADTTPTLTATGNVSGSLAANLSVASNPATGVYRWTYTPGASPTLEQIRFDGSAVISSTTFTLSCYSQTVDFATAVLTSTDIGHITSIYNKLPAGNMADESLVLAAIGSPMQAGTQVTVGTNNDKTGYALASAYDAAKTSAQAGDAMALTGGERTTLVAAVWGYLRTAAAALATTTIGRAINDFLAAYVAAPTAVQNRQEMDSNSTQLAAIAANVGTDLADDTSILAIANKLNTMLELNGSVYRLTAASLVNVPATPLVVYGAQGARAFTFQSRDTDNTTPLSGVSVFVSSDAGGVHKSQIQVSDEVGNTVWQLDVGTVYFWQARFDRTYTNNPVTEVIS